MNRTRARLPKHLLRYTVEQNYDRYTPEDQATWRFIMRQLAKFLAEHAHPAYLEGLRQTGLEIDRIPHITTIDQALAKVGWGAVPVSGFIPPAAFMEFQSLGVLPIASDMRTVEHLQYTPAPDIVHEAAGHAPFLATPEYASYLLKYGEIARHSILTQKDLAQYEAIRQLSDLKENPNSTPAEVDAAEARLTDVNRAMTTVSEAALLSRMNWWTAEYGLIGRLEDPRIFGAGLLSSVGESRLCLSAKVRKIPLSVDCINYAYDITEPQPQLFVCQDFAHLSQVLDDFAPRLSYKMGGLHGLELARQAGTVNSVQLNSGLQISGVLEEFTMGPASPDCPAFIRLGGPCQLGVLHQELPGQSVREHPQGFSSPLGLLEKQVRCLSLFQPEELSKLKIRRGERARLDFASGITVEGKLRDWTFVEGKLVVLSWQDCRVTWGDRLLFDPSWGTFDMAVGSSVVSVAGGPADREAFGQTEDFTATHVPAKVFSSHERARQQRLDEIRKLRDNPLDTTTACAQLKGLVGAHLALNASDWLEGIELLELSYQLGEQDGARLPLLNRLREHAQHHPAMAACIQDGITLASSRPPGYR